MAAEQGYTVAVAGVPASALAQCLAAFFGHHDQIWGLAWRLDRIAWLQSAGGQVRLYHATKPNAPGQSISLTPAAMLKTYRSGRVFTEEAEWRWQPEGEDTFAVLGLAEDENSLAAGLAILSEKGAVASVQRRDGWQVASTTLFLSGSIVSERDGDPLAGQTWFETRYPLPLVYPVAHGGDRRRQPRLDARIYADASGAVRLTRFCRVRTE